MGALQRLLPPLPQQHVPLAPQLGEQRKCMGTFKDGWGNFAQETKRTGRKEA